MFTDQYNYRISSTPDALKPEFYDPAKAKDKYLAPSDDKYIERTKNRKDTCLPFADYLLIWHERGKAEAEQVRKLVEMWVMIHRRYRAVTLSDAAGYWGTLPATQGRWIDYDPEQDGEIHPINIVRPDIRANVAVLMRVRPVVNVEPINQNARASAIAGYLKSMCDYFERAEWTEADRNLIFDGVHKEGTWLVEEYLCPDGEATVHAPEERQNYYAAYRCDACGANGKKELPAKLGAIATERKTEIDGQIPCPECGQPARGMIKSFTGTHLQEKSIPQSRIKHRLWSAFNFIVDRRGARSAGIETAKWMRLAENVSRSDVEADYSQIPFDQPFEHSFPLRAQQALACADWSMLGHISSPITTTNEFDEFEKLTYCLHESAYRNYCAPADFAWHDKDGNVKFDLKRGETIDEAQERCFGANQHGVRFVVINDAVVDILTPKEAILNFRDAFTDVHFNRDSASFLSVPHWDCVDLQDNITNLFSIKVESAAANSKQPVAFNSAAFDLQDFGDYYIPTKDEFADENFDLNKAIFQIPAAKTTEELNQTLEFMLTIVRPQVSSVTPAMKGESQPGQPFAAQRQQLEQSFGILSPATKSFVQMYLNSMKKKTRIAQKTWTNEQFQRVASTRGEEWSDEIIEEICRTDLDKDVRYTYAQGSDQPQSMLDQELRFYGALAQLMPFIQGGVVPPTAMQAILKKIDEFGGFDFDLSGLETSDALAQTRFERFSIATKPYENVSRQKIDALKQEVVAMMPQMQTAVGPEGDPLEMEVPMPVTAFDLFLEKLFETADVFISQFENHQAQANFFIERIVEEMAKEKPNFAMVELLDFFVQQLQTFGLAKQQEMIDKDPVLNDEKRRAEDEGAREDDRAQKDADRQADEQNGAAQADMIQRVIEAAGEEDSREFERENREHESAEAEKQRAHELELEEKRAANKPAANKTPAQK